jgi:hypothetical protein
MKKSPEAAVVRHELVNLLSKLIWACVLVYSVNHSRASNGYEVLSLPLIHLFLRGDAYDCLRRLKATILSI